MRVTEQPAFVLHRRQYSESSLLLEAWTPEHGRIGLIARSARGSKSALPALLQPFQELRLDFGGSGDLQRLVRAEPAGPALLLSHASKKRWMGCGSGFCARMRASSSATGVNRRKARKGAPSGTPPPAHWSSSSRGSTSSSILPGGVSAANRT